MRLRISVFQYSGKNAWQLAGNNTLYGLRPKAEAGGLAAATQDALCAYRAEHPDHPAAAGWSVIELADIDRWRHEAHASREWHRISVNADSQRKRWNALAELEEMDREWHLHFRCSPANLTIRKQCTWALPPRNCDLRTFVGVVGTHWHIESAFDMVKQVLVIAHQFATEAGNGLHRTLGDTYEGNRGRLTVHSRTDLWRIIPNI